MIENFIENKPLLIVEDNDDDYEILKLALEKVNLQNPVVRCLDGEDALDYLRAQGEYETDSPLVPALILLDLNMPGVDGKEILVILKSDEKLKNIPIVVLSTSTDERDINECYSLGANSYIQKPVDLDSFFMSIRSLKEYWFETSILPKGDRVLSFSGK